MDSIVNRLNDLLTKNGIDVKLNFKESNNEGHMAVIAKDLKSIELYRNNIEQDYYNSGKLSSLENYYEITLCHELGHLKDPNYSQNNSKMENLLIEYNSITCVEEKKRIIEEFFELRVVLEKDAALLGRQFVSPNLLGLYDEKNNGNLEATFLLISQIKRNEYKKLGLEY